MNIKSNALIILITILFIHSCKAPLSNENTNIVIKTTLGDIKIRLYDSTPVHRDNFIKLVKSGVYDNVLFHRVIKDFMIQAGDPLTRPGKSDLTSDTINSYTIPAEFNASCFHKKGALAAARKGNDENPEMRSSGTQFYIVEGVKYTDSELDQAEQRINSNIKQAIFNKLIKETTDSLKVSGTPVSAAEIQDIASMKMYEYFSLNGNYKIPEDQRNVYKTTGGTPRLDGTYTVFGEVTEGLDVVDKIAAVPTDGRDKPLNDIRILKIRIVKN